MLVFMFSIIIRLNILAMYEYEKNDSVLVWSKKYELNGKWKNCVTRSMD